MWIKASLHERSNSDMGKRAQMGNIKVKTIVDIGEVTIQTF